MDSSLTAVGLPIALGIIMLGLGLGLAVADFRRVVRYPRPALIALGCQALLLPALCFGLVLALDLPPAPAVGMMLLAASPGGAPRLAGVGRRESIAAGMEIGIHNSTLAITIAISPTLLNSTEMAIPAAVYGLVMFFTATAFGYLVTGRQDRASLPA
ncbi:hypothetical protein [Couchioplanes caeruleus]|uniref:Bile acid:sodium symporter n=1 Tax=Couchioplanes caeruleus subsp. caeruleus TaxID=56427 RepID=A0A1K0G9F0_9ACTN|nr:hypothetical protein [Couchioplanes caeruleus]OJF13866.1 hypothetical protein BG844_12960 [Couchioplanes caeruleus subsp. caeruleus]